MTATGDAIDRVIRHTATPKLLEAYFDPAGHFAAATFDTLSPTSPDLINETDLLVLTLLDVHAPARALRLILGEDRDDLSGYLSSIGDDVDLWEADDNKLEAAERMYRHLTSGRYPGLGEVTAHKLLARKRPRLIPVLDSVVVAALQLPAGRMWADLADALADPDRRDHLAAVRPSSAASVSLLRVLDVAVWMTYSMGRNAKALRERYSYGH